MAIYSKERQASVIGKSVTAKLRRTTSLRLLCLLVFVFALVCIVSRFHDYANLQNLALREAEFARIERVHPALVVVAFMALQVFFLAFCVPGAVFSLALLGGALFGFPTGTLIVLTSVTVGDTLGFLMARFVLRDWVHRRFGPQLSMVERGIDEDGVYYLLGMRLLPILPFFIVNLTMGVSRMPLRRFAPISFVGLAPSIAVYVEAGTRLGEIRSRSDVFSAHVLLAFGLLAALPITAHLALKAFRKRHGAIER